MLTASRAIEAHGVKPWVIAVRSAVSGRARPCMAQSEVIDRGAKCGTCVWRVVVCGAVLGRDCACPCMAKSEAIDRGAKCSTCVWRVAVRGAVSGRDCAMICTSGVSVPKRNLGQPLNIFA